MTDHEPFDGTVPWVVRASPQVQPYPWVSVRQNNTGLRHFATWCEAMNYATKEDHR